jgi:Tfp pilus assembly protein PilN
MLTLIKQKILQVRQVAGMEISLAPETGMTIHIVLLKLESSKIIKEKEVLFLHAFSELAGKIPPGCPLAISVTGRGILHKRLDAGLPDAKLLGAMLPNANPNDFYLARTSFGAFDSACIARKDLLDGILRQLSEQKLNILSVSMGPAALQYLLPYLNFDKQPLLRSNHYTLRCLAGHEAADIETVTPDNEEDLRRMEYSIGDQYVHAPALLAFGCALGLLAEGLEAPAAMGLMEKEREEYRYFKYFRAGSGALLGMLFLILLVNFFIYNHYFSKNAEWEASMSVQQAETKRAESLRSSILLKEKFIRGSGWDRSQRLSYYADRIAGLVPESTTLTNIKMNPVNTGFFGDAATLTFKRDTIQVAGTCEDPTELNRFVNNLRNISGIREVTIRNYLFRRQTGNGAFLMEIITS